MTVPTRTGTILPKTVLLCNANEMQNLARSMLCERLVNGNKVGSPCQRPDGFFRVTEGE